MPAPFAFPPSFCLQNICDITSPHFELKENPHREGANKAMLKWFERFDLYDARKADKFLNHGRFDIFAALSFPDADPVHLETCLAFFFWAFSTDDLSDEGELQSKPDDVENGHKISRSILYDVDAPEPKYPYAGMLWHLLRRIRATATVGTARRFIKAFLDFSESQVKQSHNRNVERLPPVEEFILMRRATIGAALVEAMVEYSLDLDIPDYVFEDPTFQAMSDATTDIMTWPNDLCSFNKEQADGDYQNLVCILMAEHDIDLQSAVDSLTDMISHRVEEYAQLKKQLPSWGPEVDAVVQKYHKALEHFVQGCLVWYYSSPRYFRDINPLGKEYIIWDLFKPTNEEEEA